ncbi:hypothetical protein HAPAU_39750 [Halalkalicoccus paucihalophilus]|uniref:Uncharacterized protein n=1 Tax=Halalkalicoccus paucihalophilus TaxID=1008153 RepID=A0A151A869_9EURY|nr:hypothetical protein HAPAU_39750 [Halalkalicoccus paucihalophilus]
MGWEDDNHLIFDIFNHDFLNSTTVLGCKRVRLIAADFNFELLCRRPCLYLSNVFYRQISLNHLEEYSDLLFWLSQIHEYTLVCKSN